MGKSQRDKISLPWPVPILFPNGQKKANWYTIAAARRKARQDGANAALEAGWRKSNHHSAEVSITFHPPDNRKRDLDNMLAAIKSALDGVSDTIGIDDSTWSLRIAKGEVVEHGMVQLEITPTSNGIPESEAA